MKKILLLLIVFIQLVSCKQDPLAGFVDLDLMKEGVPVKIKAPADAEVVVNDMGLLKDVTIKAGEKFSLQLMAGSKTSNDLPSLIANELKAVKSEKYFSKIISQDEAGFIYEKNIEGKMNYDFRLIKIQGNNEFDFQRSLMGEYSQEDVELMYKAVK